MREIEERFNDDADGMLRTHSPGRMTSDDVAVIICRDDFLRLAKANAGETMTIEVDVSPNKHFDPKTAYKYLTTAGHIIELDPQGVHSENGVTSVTGRKQSTERIAA